MSLVGVSHKKIKVASLCSLAPPVTKLWNDAFEYAYIGKCDNVIAELEGFDVLLVSIETKLDKAYIEKLPNSITAIATYSVGLDHLDTDALARRSIAVLNTPDVLSTAVAENALFLALGVARRATESIALIRSGNWTGWTPSQLIGFELSGKNVGILGMGRIGREIGKKFAGMSANIIYHNRTRLPPELEGEAVFCDTAELLFSQSDVLVLACPSTEKTKGIVSRSRLELMKPSAVVINIARGDIVDDDALIAALESRVIAGAGLDVFNNEPSYDRRYGNLHNVFMLPHVGSSTIEARLRMASILIDGVRALACGQKPKNLISTSGK